MGYVAMLPSSDSMKRKTPKNTRRGWRSRTTVRTGINMERQLLLNSKREHESRAAAAMGWGAIENPKNAIITKSTETL
jgi:hypothetical protein